MNQHRGHVPPGGPTPTTDPAEPVRGSVRRTWLNPPRHDDPHTVVVVEYTQCQAAVVVAALRQAAEQTGDTDTARTLRIAAEDLESARKTPAEADATGLSREASWHPANQAHRVYLAAIRNACRWLGATGVASEAIHTAAAIAHSRGGDDAKQALINHIRFATDSAAETTYPPRPTSTEEAR